MDSPLLIIGDELWYVVGGGIVFVRIFDRKTIYLSRILGTPSPLSGGLGTVFKITPSGG
jgi:hypothetical protein